MTLSTHSILQVHRTGNKSGNRERSLTLRFFFRQFEQEKLIFRWIFGNRTSPHCYLRVAKLSVYPFEDCFRQSLKIFPILSYPVPLWSSNSFTVFFNPTELIFWPLNQVKGIFPVPKTTRKNRDFVPFISNRDFQKSASTTATRTRQSKKNCKCVLKVCTASSRPLLWGRNHSEKLSMFRFRTLRYLYM